MQNRLDIFPNLRSDELPQRFAYEVDYANPELIELRTAVSNNKHGKDKAYPIYRYLKGNKDIIVFPYEGPSGYAKTFTSSEARYITLRDYQVKPVNEVIRRLKDYGGVFLKAPCGTGKTIMALSVCERMSYENIAILVDQKDIADQWRDRINEFLPHETVEVFHSKANKVKELRDSKARFNIIVAQSLMRENWVDDPVVFDFLICDEAHVFSAPCFCGSMFNLDYHNSLALTATEDRKDGLEWVFESFLASSTVEVSAKTLEARVVMPEIEVDINWLDFCPAWCNRIKGMTWRNKCESCEHFVGYPVRCGGNLPMSKFGPAWDKKKLMWTPLLVAVCSAEKYLAKFLTVINKMHQADRQILIFNQFREPLQWLYERACEKHGEDVCGLYVSNTKNAKEELEKPLTFTTYKMSQKALDVPHKDSAILTSPISDIRQTVGRITRIKDGKNQPIVFDPVIKNVRVLERQARKRVRQYDELGFKVT